MHLSINFTKYSRYLLFVITSLFFCACSNDEKPDIFKFKSGTFGSIKGEFAARFPDKPKVSKRKFNVGNVEYHEYAFIHRIANEHVYHVSYTDFPIAFLEQIDIFSTFDQSIQTLITQVGDFRVNEKIINEKTRFDTDITYSLFSSIPGTMMKARLVQKGNRVYTIYFACSRRQPNTEDIDNFLNSFKDYKTGLD